MTPTRFKVVKHFLKATNNVSFSELLQYFFAPSYKTKANRIIQRKEEENQYLKVYFPEIATPLYFPREINAHSLNQVVVECFDPSNWHFYEIPQTKVTPEDIVIDCGAAEGLFALIVADRCQQIYLIEPLPRFVDALKHTFKHSPNVEIVPVAISDREFSTKMISNDISSVLSDEGDGDTVEVTTLDKLFYEKELPVTYLKLDLEGYDYLALKGAEELIKKNKPKIAITTYHCKEHAAQIEQYLKGLVPEYNILCKGIYQETGSPVMLHAWV